MTYSTLAFARCIISFHLAVGFGYWLYDLYKARRASISIYFMLLVLLRLPPRWSQSSQLAFFAYLLNGYSSGRVCMHIEQGSPNCWPIFNIQLGREEGHQKYFTVPFDTRLLKIEQEVVEDGPTCFVLYLQVGVWYPSKERQRQEPESGI